MSTGTHPVTMAHVYVPPEWALQAAIWTAWPASEDEWNGDLEAPRRDCAAMIRALAATTRVRLLVNGGEAAASARAALGGIPNCDIVAARYGDIWLRDIGPIFARGEDGNALGLRFRANGWGGKYDLADDATVGCDICRLAGVPARRFDFVLEGGAIDRDGAGTVLTTRQTLLNANRNGWSQAQAETALAEAVGARKTIWIDEGLAGDHTDGHVDNLARFIAPGRVVCQSPAGADDPNAATLTRIAETLRDATDADGRRLDVVQIPGPGRVLAASGDVVPASHMNFVIGNGVVVVPIYGTATSAAAIAALQAAMPSHRVVGLASHGLIGSGDAGGGSFHCITQQQPRFEQDQDRQPCPDC